MICGFNTISIKTSACFSRETDYKMHTKNIKALESPKQFWKRQNWKTGLTWYLDSLQHYSNQNSVFWCKVDVGYQWNRSLEIDNTNMVNSAEVITEQVELTYIKCTAAISASNFIPGHLSKKNENMSPWRLVFKCSWPLYSS